MFSQLPGMDLHGFLQSFCRTKQLFIQLGITSSSIVGIRIYECLFATFVQRPRQTQPVAYLAMVLNQYRKGIFCGI